MSATETEPDMPERPDLETAPWGDQIRLSEEGNTGAYILVDEGSLVDVTEME